MVLISSERAVLASKSRFESRMSFGKLIALFTSRVRSHRCLMCSLLGGPWTQRTGRLKGLNGVGCA